MMNNYFTICSFFYICLVSIIYFFRKRVINYETKIYSRIIIINLLTTIFAIISSITIMNMNKVPVLNMIINKILLFFFGCWGTYFAKYIYFASHEFKSEEEFGKRYKLISKIVYVILAISLIVIIALPLYFSNENKVIYSYGPAANYIFGLALVYVLFFCYCILFNLKNIKNKKMIPLYIYMIFGFVVIVIQKMYPGLLLTTAMETFITILMYFTIENPDIKLIEDLNAAKEQAEKANRAKTDFLSNMSHEIRTPLNAILGFSQILSESKNLDEEDKGLVKDICTAGNSLIELVNGILDISKIEANKLEIVNSDYEFKKIFDEMVLLTKGRIGEKPLTFNYFYDESIPKYFYGDSSRIKQIGINLLTNAVKYTKEGSVTLRVSSVIHGNMCRIILCVEDTGIGIKEENIDKLFTKFERLGVEKQTTVEGTGLGLAITKKLVELMDGKILVNSKYGQGSKFTVIIDQKIIDKKEEVKPSVNNEVSVKEVINAKEKKILIVDDNMLNIKVASRLLQQFGFDSIDSASSGEECINKVKNNNYDLILMDDMMPKMTGSETFTHLKEIDGFKTPVIALTANAISGMREKYIEYGFNDYLSKPIERAELNRVVLKYLS